jgi:methylated-DNA-[protein]-cysteine S-methyltransferase
MRKKKGVARLAKSTRADIISPDPIPSNPRRASMIFKSRWGWMGLAEAANGIARIVLPKASKHIVVSELRTGTRGFRQTARSSRLRVARRQLTEYLAGTRTSFNLPLDLSEGTDFQRQVWKALQTVPFGQLRSYQAIAARVGGEQYARAVGNAVGANPLPIVIPCHRIVMRNSSLGGFSGGLPTKQRLLALEGTLSQLRRVGKVS